MFSSGNYLRWEFWVLLSNLMSFVHQVSTSNVRSILSTICDQFGATSPEAWLDWIQFEETQGRWIPTTAGLILKSLLWIRIRTSPHSFWLAGSGSALGIRIRIQEVQIKKTHKSEENSSAHCSLKRDEDFSCSSNVPYGGLGISKL
jgi:hypothetical protein